MTKQKKQPKKRSPFVRVGRRKYEAMQAKVAAFPKELADAVREAERLGRVAKGKVEDYCLKEIGQCDSYNPADHRRCSQFKGHLQFGYPHQCSISYPNPNDSSSWILQSISWGFEPVKPRTYGWGDFDSRVASVAGSEEHKK
jgi:hypothetical protein